MRILFVLRHQHYTRLFESTMDALGACGHELHIALERENEHWTRDETHTMLDRLCARHPAITRGMAPGREDEWRTFAYAVREAIDYLRYLEPEYAEAPSLRARAALQAPALVVRVSGWRLVRTRRGIALLRRALRWLERSVPNSPTIEGFLRARRPDLLLMTPLVAEPSQTDYVRAARSLGVSSGLCVASWDNLTNKGLIHLPPDRVYVWNDEQRREAVTLHGVPTERVVTTGAQCFDQWFSWGPSTTAEEFREQRGLPAGAMLLYVCSSAFIAPRETEFVERWLEALRRHPDPHLAQAAVLIRPHPKSGVQWRDSDLGDRRSVAVWPPAGTMRIDEEARSVYADSIHHSGAVVGINTSALIESAILGRRVFTVLDPEFRHAQAGTLHFQYLLRANGGPLTVADGFEQHFDQLSAALRGDGETGEVERSFVARFVRPYGLERPALPLLVDALEQQAREPAPSPSPVTTSARRAAVLRPAALAAGWWKRHVAKRGVRRTLARWSRRRLRRLYRVGRYRGGLAVRALIDHGRDRSLPQRFGSSPNGRDTQAASVGDHSPEAPRAGEHSAARRH